MHERLLRILGLGPLPAPAIMAALDMTQPTLSRLVQRAGTDVVVGGKGRATRYAARRRILGVDDPIPAYVVDHLGGVRVLGQLQPVEPAGFLWRPMAPSTSMQWFVDLPWFLDDARPAGFLGRLVPRRHHALGLPDDVRIWNGDHVLRFITRHGDDLVGALVVGDEALQRRQRLEPQLVDDGDYPRLATEVLAGGLPGSSAAGEQPKFLADRVDDGVHRAVLVKWSPPMTDTAIGQRWADLLLCEHHALEALRDTGVPAARTRIVDVGGRRFLESERFDRLAGGGRRGVVSLAALDAEYVGSDHRSWSMTTSALLQHKRIGAEDHRQVRVAEAFGGLIGNTDMHHGNLSFFVDGLTITGLAPLYDMLPMRYAPMAGEVVARVVDIVAPTPADADITDVVIAAALRFWRNVLDDERASPGLVEIGRRHRDLIASRCRDGR